MKYLVLKEFVTDNKYYRCGEYYVTNYSGAFTQNLIKYKFIVESIGRAKPHKNIHAPKVVGIIQYIFA